VDPVPDPLLFYNDIVLFICRHCKLRVDRAKLLEMSHVQKSAFLKLANTFEKYGKELHPSPKSSSCNVEDDEYKPVSLMNKMGRYYYCYSMTQVNVPVRARTCNLNSFKAYAFGCYDVRVHNPLHFTVLLSSVSEQYIQNCAL
jgi:hypothetical protein